jgi:hypothetical protein
MNALQLTVSASEEEETNSEGTFQKVAPIDYLFGAPNAEPAPAPELPEHSIRYERGSLIYAMDGPVGTLKQIVIDEEMAEVKALVVRMTTKKESVLVPPDLVDKSVGAALMLNVTQEQFAKGASRSPRFEARMFTGANAETVGKAIPMVFHGDARRSVVRISSDQVETSESHKASLSSLASNERRSWKAIFARG